MEDDERARFWSKERIIFVLIFVAGLIIGGALTNQVLDPMLYGVQGADQNSLVELNERLDLRNDELFNCLLENSVDPSSCGS